MTIQEHMKLGSNVIAIEKMFYVVVYCVSAFKDNSQNKKGRGKGGMCQMRPKVNGSPGLENPCPLNQEGSGLQSKLV